MNELRVLCPSGSQKFVKIIRTLLADAGYDPQIEITSNFQEFATALDRRATDVIIGEHRDRGFSTDQALALCRGSEFPIPYFVFVKTLGERRAIDLMTQKALLIAKGSPLEMLPILEYELKSSRNLLRLKDIERRTIQAPKLEALGRLAGGVAHDFNNVLATIMICSEQILSIAPASGPIAETVRLMLTVGEKGTRLTKQLLAFTRNQVSEPEVVDLNALIRNMSKLLKPLVGEHIEFVALLQDELHNVKIDPVHIEQILINLIVNARDAMPNGGRLTLQTGNVDFESFRNDFFEVKPGRYVMFSVADTGHGMDAKTKSKIFEPFFSTKGENGTGLGLSTVYGIVKQNQGYVTVHSEPGKGSIFHVYLPESELPLGKLKVENVTDAGDQELGKAGILLVEDDRDLRRVLGSALKAAGLSVFVADSPEGALDLAQDDSNEIEILVTDVVMPRVRGTELAKRILNHRPNIKILFISGYLDFDPSELAIFQAETHFMQKPFTVQALIKKIAQLHQFHEVPSIRARA